MIGILGRGFGLSTQQGLKWAWQWGMEQSLCRFAEEAWKRRLWTQPHTLIFREDGPRALLASAELLALHPLSILKMDN